MKKSYIQNQSINNTYKQKKTYIHKMREDSLFFEYNLLPEEYDVFSEIIDYEKLGCLEEQKDLLIEITNQINKSLKIINCKYGVLKVLPKMEISADADGAIVMNWPYSLYRIYFDIEKRVNESFYGLVIRDSENGIQTRTEIITRENCAEIISYILQYVFNCV